MINSKMALFLCFSLLSLTLYAQENEGTDYPTEQESYKNNVLDGMVKYKSRHKPWRIRTSFGNKKFGNIDISKLPISSSYLAALDIPTFTLYDNLYLGIGLFTSVNLLEDTALISSEIVFGANVNLNYSFEVIEGLYVVPMVGYGYLGASTTEVSEISLDPDVTFDIRTGTDINYGVFLDFSFNLQPKGFGLTAGYTNYERFTFGVQYGR
jgi:hypothetical protein